MTRIEKTILSLILLFSGCFLLLNHLIPLMSDDFVYHYFFYDVDVYSNRMIESVGDFLESLYNIYFEHNGRVLNNAWSLLFCGIFEKWVFNIVNSILFGCALFFTWKLSGNGAKSRTNQLWLFSLTLLYYFALSTIPGDTLFWISGATNYLWPLTFCLAMLFFFERYFIAQQKALSPVWGILAGLFIGQSHELLSLSLSGAFFIWFITHPKQFRGNIIYFIVAFWISSLSVVLSPGIVKRAESTISFDGTLLTLIKERIAIFGALTIRSVVPVILFLEMGFYLWVKGRKELFDLIKREQLLVSIILINLIFLFATKTAFLRGYFVLSVFSFLMIVRTLSDFKICSNKIFLRMSGAIALVCSLAAIYMAATTYAELGRYFDQITKQIKAADSKAIIPVEDFNPKGHFVPSAFLIEPNRYHFSNRFMSFYYGKEYIQLIPKTIYQALYARPEQLPDIGAEGRMKLHKFDCFYLLPIHPDQLSPEQEYIEYEKNESVVTDAGQIPFYVRIFRYLLGANQKAAEQYFTIEKENSIYIVFPQKDNIRQITVPIKEAGKEKQQTFTL